MKLRAKFTLTLVFLVGFAVASVGGITLYSDYRQLQQETKNHHELLTKRLAKICEESLYQSNLIFVNYVKTLRSEAGFTSASFVDLNNVIQMHSDSFQIDLPKPQLSEETFLIYEIPVEYGGRNVGTAQTVFDRQKTHAALKQSFRATLFRTFWISLIALILSVFVAWALASTLVKPIEQLVAGMREISTGHLKPVVVPTSQDELGWMGTELNNTVQKLGELDEMKRDFVNGVTHDFKSPLAAIQSAVEVLHMKLPDALRSDEDVSDSLLSLNNNADRLQHFVRQLLEVAKIERGSVPVLKEKTNLMTLVQKVAGYYKQIANRRQVKISVTGESPLWVNCDPEKMDQVLSNLLSNSLKFTPAGSIQINLSKNRQSEVQVDIRDTGAGISKENQSRLFENFFTTAPSPIGAQDFPKGTGLGLSIVKGWINAHGGKISIHSDGVGKGTTVSFTLPQLEKAA